MAKYRKKAIIEAFQYDGDLKGSDGQYYVPEWAENAYRKGIIYYFEGNGNPPELFVMGQQVKVNDYIVHNVNGEIYPIRKEIFEKSYEQVNYYKEENEMTVGELKAVIKDLNDSVKIGIMESYDPETDVAEYNECQELAVLPEQGSDVLIFSAFETGIGETQEESEEE